MPDMNKVYLMGNLTRAPELRYTPNGVAICEFGMAINRRYLSNGIRKDETTFIDVNVWQRQAEICKNRLQKGSLVLIEGRLKTDQWEDRDTGKRRSKILAVAERVHFVATPPRDDNAPDGYEQEPGGQQGQQRQYGSQRQQYPQRQPAADRQGGGQPQPQPPVPAPAPAQHEEQPPPEPEYNGPAGDDDTENVPF